MDDCKLLCRKIIELLEEDTRLISFSLKGEILDGYRQAVQAEEDYMQNIKKNILLIINETI